MDRHKAARLLCQYSFWYNANAQSFNGVNLALVNGVDTENIIIPVLSVPYRGLEKRWRSYGQNRRVYRFDNGYGASAIPDRFSDWEVFPVKFTGPGPDDFELCDNCSMSRHRRLRPADIDMNEPYNGVGEKSLQRLLRHIRSMNGAGNFRGIGIPDDIGCYYLREV